MLELLQVSDFWFETFQYSNILFNVVLSQFQEVGSIIGKKGEIVKRFRDEVCTTMILPICTHVHVKGLPFQSIFNVILLFRYQGECM
jgi:hypothetical protein